MRRLTWIPVFTLIVGPLALGAGCGKSDSAPPAASATEAAAAAPAPAAGPKTASPELAVTEFLEAVRTGSDKRASQMLTPLAREKVAEQNMVVAPPGSDTAKFEIGQVERLGEDGARVITKWTDMGDNGQQRTDEVIWMVRLVNEGWRIAGVAAPVFEGEPPLLLNFEDPADMIRKQQMVREEIRRRMEQESQGAPPADPNAAAMPASNAAAEAAAPTQPGEAAAALQPADATSTAPAQANESMPVQATNPETPARR